MFRERTSFTRCTGRVCQRPNFILLLQELDMFKEMCKICNQKYLCVYTQQHYASHALQALSKQRKAEQLEQEKIAQQKEKLRVEMEGEVSSGKRRAAEK